MVLFGNLQIIFDFYHDKSEANVMTVDRHFRSAIADAIDMFLRGEIDNWALDDAISSTQTDDVLCREIARQIWLFYDDVRRYTNEGSKALQPTYTAILRRWESLLRTEIEWSSIAAPTSSNRSSKRWSWVRSFISNRRATRSKFKRNEYWPLSDAGAWEALDLKQAKR